MAVVSIVIAVSAGVIGEILRFKSLSSRFASSVERPVRLALIPCSFNCFCLLFTLASGDAVKKNLTFLRGHKRVRKYIPVSLNTHKSIRNEQ